MEERNLTIYKVIELPDSTARMTCLYYNGKYTMPSIEFKEHIIFQNENWDHGVWIFGEFYEFLKKWKNRTLSVEDIETDIYQEYNGNEWQETDVDDLIDLIEQAIEFGWDKLT